MIKSPWSEIELLTKIARDVSEHAQDVRSRTEGETVGNFTNSYLADKIEAVARQAERSIGELESDLQKQGLPRDHGDTL